MFHYYLIDAQLNDILDEIKIQCTPTFVRDCAHVEALSDADIRRGLYQLRRTARLINDSPNSPFVEHSHNGLYRPRPAK